MKNPDPSGPRAFEDRETRRKNLRKHPIFTRKADRLRQAVLKMPVASAAHGPTMPVGRRESPQLSKRRSVRAAGILGQRPSAQSRARIWVHRSPHA